MACDTLPLSDEVTRRSAWRASRGDPNGQWRPRYRDPAGREHARHFDRKVDATRWLDSVTAAIETGTYVDPKASDCALGEYAETWLSRQVQLKPSTRSRYTPIVPKHIISEFGPIPLAKIERSAVAAWVMELVEAGLAGPTVRHAHRILHMILSTAVDDGRLVKNPRLGSSCPGTGAARSDSSPTQRSRAWQTPPGWTGSSSSCSPTAA
jgi:hypothetical protein